MNYVFRSAVDAIKGQIFKAVLAKLSSSNLRQESAAPVLLERLEELAEPYAKAFPKAVSYVIAKVALAFVILPSFFAFFSEGLRQIDLLGRLAPSAYLIGYFVIFACAMLSFFMIKPPKVERHAYTQRREFSPAYTSPASTDEAPLPKDFENVEQIRRPLSASELLLAELRAERASFFSPRT